LISYLHADSPQFNDSYIIDGAAGGERAASELLHNITKHLEPREDFQHDYKINIRIYVNLLGLAQTYHAAAITNGVNVFLKFVQGFNKSYELIEIVDAGDFKEAADSKIKGMTLPLRSNCLLTTRAANFNLYRRNIHCKHIMFAGCSDNSYAGFLGQYTSAGANGAPPLTLIRGREVAKDIKPLTDKIETIAFPELFREVGIPKRKPTETAAWATPAHNPSVSSVTNGMSNLIVRTPSASSATTGATTISTPTTAQSISSGTSTTIPPQPFIWQNAHGQRLDPPLGTIDLNLANTIKKRKLCNNYHLRGKCDSFHCAHEHDGGKKLSEEERKTLRFVARSRPCQRGLLCEDPKCVDGHRCAFGERCTKSDCWFSDAMHDVSNEGQTRVIVEAPRKLIQV
jgi:hypothetical protein